MLLVRAIWSSYSRKYTDKIDKFSAYGPYANAP